MTVPLSAPLSTVIPIFVKHSKQHWFYLLLVILSLLVASAGLSSVFLISSAALKSLDSNQQNLAYVIRPKDEQQITNDLYTRLRQQGVIDAIAFDRIKIDVNNQPVTVVGVDIYPLMNNRLASQFTTKNNENNDADFGLYASNTLFISESDLTALQISPSEKVLIGGKEFALSSAESLQFSALDDGRQPRLFTDLLTLRAWLPNSFEDGLSGIAIINSRSTNERAVINNLINDTAFLRPIANNQDTQQMGASFSFHLIAMAALMAIVCFFIITNALNMLMTYRTQLIENLHKLGIARTHTLVALLIELVFFCALGTLVGSLLGISCTLFFAEQVESTLGLLLRRGSLSAGIPVWSAGVLSMLFSLLGMLIALLPSLQRIYVNRQRPKTNKSIQITALGVALFGVAIGLLQLKTKLGDLLALSLCLLGMSLWVTVLVPKIFKALGLIVPKRLAILHWSITSGSELAARCKLSASAYFIALAAAVGLSTMVDSFRQATDDWLTQRLAAPAYIYLDETQPLPAISGIEWIPRTVGDITINDQLVAYTTYPNNPQYQEALSFYQGANIPWSDFYNGKALFINQQLSFRLGIGVGDTVTFSNLELDIPVSVAGIYYDFGNPENQAMVATELASQFDSRHPAVAVHTEQATQDWDAFKNELIKRIPEANFLTKPELLALSMRTFDNTFLLTDMLSVVALLVSALSFAITIALLSRHLDSQVNTLQSIGIALNRIRVMITLQFCLICLIVSVLAIPAGIAFAQLLISTVNVNAFGWTYPLIANTSNLAAISGAGFTLMCVVCLITFWRRSVDTAQIRYRVTTWALPVMLSMTLFSTGCSKQDSQTLFQNIDKQASINYSYVDPNQPIELPFDHHAHNDFQLEWWYVTAVLTDDLQQDYPFQFTVFRFNQQGEQRYMVHASLHSPNDHWFEERFANPALPYIKFESSPFVFSLDDWSWQSQSEKPFPATIKSTWWQGPTLTLSFVPKGPYVLHGNNGIRAKSANQKHVSYYYSQPFLQVSGSLTHEGETTRLSGKGWYDHEWTSQLVQDDVEGWDWFSLHLDDGSKLMVFRMRTKNQVDYYTGTFIDAQGQQTLVSADDFSLKNTDKTDDIPLTWRLEYPAINLDVELTPMKKHQWNCGFTQYYEGGVNVSGTIQGKGFMELTGYAAPSSACSRAD